uniref:Protein FAM110B-like n=1 Tax=Sinocyclocheilus anshuiensis TaxID=1608454 RepID=A0A671S639_9TELE
MKPLTPIGSPSPLRLLNKGPDYLRRQMDAGSRGHSVSAVERLEADKAKYVKKNCRNETEVETNNANKPPVPSPRTPTIVPLVAPRSAPIMRRSNGKRMLRPDSLVIYRQKKECKSPSGSGENASGNLEAKGYSFVRRLFQGSMREKSGGNEAQKMVINEEKSSSSRDGDSRMSWSNDKDTPVIPQMRSDLKRSKSELRLRCSLAMSEQERFFGYCGLDLDMVERLGPENFLTGASSVDTLSLLLRSIGGGGSEPSEFSRHSGDGLFQEELAEQIPTGVSIIERNARVIKWLYGCRNAAQEGPKESTV